MAEELSDRTLRYRVKRIALRTSYSLSCIALALRAMRRDDDVKFESEMADLQKAIQDLGEIADELI